MPQSPTMVPPSTRRAPTGVLLVLMGLMVGGTCPPHDAAAETIETAPKPLARMRPGTIVAKPAPQGWTHLILFARPRLGAGDTAAASATAKRFVSMFSTAMAARVTQKDGIYSLDDVAIGHSMKIDGKQVIVTSNTASALGGKLGLMGGKILSGAEEALAGVQQVARYSTMMLFDAKALIHHNETHQHMTVRHMIWVSKQTGQLGTAVWLLQHDTAEQRSLAHRHFVVLPPQLVEDRVLHVDKTKISLGIPTKEAFALERLPPGTKYNFTDALGAHAARVTFTPAQVQQFAVAFAQAVAQGPVQVAERPATP